MITVVDYGMGNLGSIANMLKKLGAGACVTQDPEMVARAEKLILPGVGSFDRGMKNLEAFGLIPALHQRVLHDKVPILGLCLGMQLFSQRSEEGAGPGLGWIDADTVRFCFDGMGRALKVPHMGWNIVRFTQPSPLATDMADDSRFYFVHSFHVVCRNPANVLMTTEHGYLFASGIVQENIIGMQFHPEKSHRFGMQLFRNFIRL